MHRGDKLDEERPFEEQTLWDAREGEAQLELQTIITAALQSARSDLGRGAVHKDWKPARHWC